MKTKTKITVIIQGGCLWSAYATDPGLTFEVIDMDNLEEEIGAKAAEKKCEHFEKDPKWHCIY